MKTFKSNWWGVLLVTACLFSTGCSSDDEGNGNGDGNGSGNTPFIVSLNDKNYSEGTQRLFVPFTGATYEFTIKAPAEVTWTVETEDVAPSNFLTVNPVGNGQGEKIIQVTAAKNETKEEGHIGTVNITNSSNNSVIKFIFDQKEKETKIPKGITMNGTDYYTGKTYTQSNEEFYEEDSRFNIYHMVEGPNVAILYESTWGKNPETDPNFPLNREEAVEKAEDVYAWMIDQAKFANWTTSVATKYKLLILVKYQDGTSSVGFGSDDVGILIVPAKGITKYNKYGVPGVLQHEVMHCFQYITHYDNRETIYGWSGPIYEMTSQWSLLRRFPDWPDLEYNHFTDFMKNTHKAFMHKDNQYHSPYVLAFWEYKHLNMVSKLWQGNRTVDNQDPVQTYKRINDLTQEQFNDEMYEGVCRFVTWDIPTLKDANAHHIDKHQYKLAEVSPTKFKADPNTCPQNYGYNCIKLKAPAAGKTVTIDFKGNVNLSGYKIKNGPYKGWRYGFVALKENGERIYGEMNKEESKRITFTVPEGGIKNLWVVVMGAPTTHWKCVDGEEYGWPYEFSLNGTTLDTPKAL